MIMKSISSLTTVRFGFFIRANNWTTTREHGLCSEDYVRPLSHNLTQKTAQKIPSKQGPVERARYASTRTAAPLALD